jgi:hypothetical protein
MDRRGVVKVFAPTEESREQTIELTPTTLFVSFLRRAGLDRFLVFSRLPLALSQDNW